MIVHAMENGETAIVFTDVHMFRTEEGASRTYKYLRRQGYTVIRPHENLEIAYGKEDVICRRFSKRTKINDKTQGSVQIGRQ